MSNLLNFKFGTYANFKSKYDGENKQYNPGTVYVTSDEQAMYIDLNENGTDKRIRIGDIIVYQDVSKALPPYHKNAFYYFWETNTLARYQHDETQQKDAWKVINSTAAIESVVESLSNELSNMGLRVDNLETFKNNVDQTITDYGTRIGTLETDIDTKVNNSDFETYKTTTSEAMTQAHNSLTQAASNAQAAAEGAQTTANQALALAQQNESNKATVSALDEVAKSVDNLKGTKGDAATAVTVYGAKAAAAAAHKAADDAKTAADNAQAAAEDAKTEANKKLNLTGGTMTGSITMSTGTKITLTDEPSEETDAVNKKYVDGVKSTLIGQAVNGEASIKGALKTAQDAQAAANDAKTAADNAQAAAENAKDTSLALAGGTMTGSIIMSTGTKITLTDGPDVDTDATNKKYVDDTIAASIKANDAMTFKGTLGSNGTIATLPTDATVYSAEDNNLLKDVKPQNGDTFKVIASGTYADIPAKIGDLFINTGADDETPVWVHITSGYEDTYLQTITVQSEDVYTKASGNAIEAGVVYYTFNSGTNQYDVVNSPNNEQISTYYVKNITKKLCLNNGLEENITNSVSSIEFKGHEESNIVFDLSTNAGVNVVTASMVWGEF